MRSFSVEVVYTSCVTMDDGDSVLNFTFSPHKTNNNIKVGMANTLKETSPAYNFFAIIKLINNTPTKQLPNKMVSMYMTELDYIVPYLFK